jgi:isoleucyl-tRNA synthetase
VIDRELEESMQIFQDVEESVAKLRQEKGVKLRHPVKKVKVSGNKAVKNAVSELNELLKERLNAKAVEFEKVNLDYEVKLDYANAGPKLGGDVGKVESALNEMDHEHLASRVESGEKVEVAGHTLSEEMFEVRTHVPEGMEGEEFSQGTVYIDDEMTEELKDEAFIAELVRDIQQKRKEAGLDVEDSIDLSITGDTDIVEQFEEELHDRMKASSVAYEDADHENSGSVEFEGRKAVYGFSKRVK